MNEISISGTLAFAAGQADAASIGAGIAARDEINDRMRSLLAFQKASHEEVDILDDGICGDARVGPSIAVGPRHLLKDDFFGPALLKLRPVQ